MKMITRTVTMMAMLIPGTLAHAADRWDQVSTGSIEINMPNAEAVLLDTVADAKGTFELYEPKLNRGETIVVPLRVTGSKERPSLYMKIKKCMSFYCQEAELDADVVTESVKGNCKHAWSIGIDIRRSTPIIVEQYDHMRILACYTPRNDREGTLALNGAVRRGSGYSQGQIQGAILEVLRAQFGPMSDAIRKNLRKHGSNPNVRLILRHRLLK